MTQSGDVASLAVAWLIDDVMLTNIEEAAKEYAAGEHLVVPLVLASALSSLQEENARLREALEPLLDQAEHVCLGAHTPADIKHSARLLHPLCVAARKSLQPIPEEVGKP